MSANLGLRPSVGTWLQGCKPATTLTVNKASPECGKAFLEGMSVNFGPRPSVGTWLQGSAPATTLTVNKVSPECGKSSLGDMSVNFVLRPSVGTWLQALAGQGREGTVMKDMAKHSFNETMEQASDDHASTTAGSASPASTGPGTPRDDRFRTLEVLTDPHMWRNDPDINPEEREKRLSPEAFKSVFGMVKDDFGKLPKWRQDLLKKNHCLF